MRRILLLVYARRWTVYDHVISESTDRSPNSPMADFWGRTGYSMQEVMYWRRA